MSSVQSLPTELWIIILDDIKEFIIHPAASCTYMNFTENKLYRPSPMDRSTNDHPYCQLRLVCRTFNYHLGSPSYFFLARGEIAIPGDAKVLYISGFSIIPNFFARISAGPIECYRIVSLHMSGSFSYLMGMEPFETLCSHSVYLTSMRSLTLRLTDYLREHQSAEFWRRLHEAFPLLEFLVVDLGFRVGRPTLSTEPDEIITFEKLEVIDLGRDTYYSGLRLPLLRHMALRRCPPSEVTIFDHSPLLESALFFSIESGTRVDLRSLSNLRLLGVQRWGHRTRFRGEIILAPGHPLAHLCIYVQSNPPGPNYLLTWVKNIRGYLPAIVRITLDVSGLDSLTRSWLRIDLEDGGLHACGLRVMPDSLGAPCIILERVPVTAPEGKPKPITIRKGLKHSWKQFRSVFS